jgi:hypothetical protein
MKLRQIVYAAMFILILSLGVVASAAAAPGNADEFTFAYRQLFYQPGEETNPGGNTHLDDVYSYGLINATDDRVDGTIYFLSQCQTVHDQGDWGPCHGEFWIEQDGVRVWEGVFRYAPFDDERAGSIYHGRGLGIYQGLTLEIEARRGGIRTGFVRNGGN